MGGIGYLYDNNLNYSYCLTHLSALQANNKIKNIYCLDKKIFKPKNNNKVIILNQNLKSIKDICIDIVIISTPTHIHYQSFNNVISTLKPKIILLEKPGTDNHKDYQKILNKCNKKGITLICNYYRNFDVFFKKLFKYLDKDYNEIIIKYSKEIYVHLPHFINFTNFIAKGDCQIVILNKKMKNNREVDFLLKYKNCKIYVLNNEEDKNEMTIENNKYSIISSENFNSFIILKKKNSDIFKNKFSIISSRVYKNKNLNKYQKIVYDKIFKNFKNKEYTNQLNRNSFNTLKILNSVEKKSALL